MGGTRGLPRIRISLKCLALNSGYSILSTVGNVGVTLSLFTLVAGLTLAAPGASFGPTPVYGTRGGRIE